jgi:acylphosphatase
MTVMEGRDDKAVMARIRGRVQGVGFRAWTAGEARTLGLSGWVRNEPDGTVTAMLAGPAGDVDAMVARLKRGPSGARVAGVELEPAVPGDTPASFDIRR